jgi:outer membrane protein assembly factor BamB
MAVECRLLALNLEDGAVIWERTALTIDNPPRIHGTHSYASDTPVTDGDHIWFSFSNFGRLFCYDAEGAEVWQRDFGMPKSRNNWGMCTSPVLFKGNVIFNVDRENGSLITAMNRKTGREVWSVERDETGGWSVPLVAETGDSAEIVVNGQNFIRGYDASNGRQLWQHGGTEKHIIPSPIFHGGLIYVGQGRNACVMAVKPGARGNITTGEDGTLSPHVQWYQPNGGPYCTSLTVAGDYVYAVTDHSSSLLNIFHAKTGKLVDKARFPAPSSKFYASPIVVGDKILYTHQSGITYVLQVGPKLEILWENNLGEAVQASLAVSRSNLLIRGERHLFCIR